MMDPGPVIGSNITFLGERALLDESVDAVLCWDVFDDLVSAAVRRRRGRRDSNP